VGLDAKKPTGDSVETFVRRSVRFAQEFHRVLRRGYYFNAFHLPNTLHTFGTTAVGNDEEGGRLKHIDRRGHLRFNELPFRCQRGRRLSVLLFQPGRLLGFVNRGLRTQSSIPPQMIVVLSRFLPEPVPLKRCGAAGFQKFASPSGNRDGRKAKDGARLVQLNNC